MLGGSTDGSVRRGSTLRRNYAYELTGKELGASEKACNRRNHSQRQLLTDPNIIIVEVLTFVTFRSKKESRRDRKFFMWLDNHSMPRRNMNSTSLLCIVSKNRNKRVLSIRVTCAYLSGSSVLNGVGPFRAVAEGIQHGSSLELLAVPEFP